jgi:hypothetical protein
MRRGCCHTASARAGSGASAIRDPGASVGDSARLALEVRLRHPHCRTPSHMSNNRLTDEAEVSADCKHPEPEYLGENRGVKFLRCDVCSRVYVLQEGRVWAIPTVVRSPQG